MSLGDSFREVLDAARAGGEWAWTLIYKDLAPVVLGYLRAQGAREPEDLLGEVFLHVVRGAGSFQGDESGFRSWVFVIAHHRVLDERRTLTRRPETPAETEQLDTPAPGDVADEAIAGIATQRVRMILGQISPAQREVLLLRIIGGLTVDEIARVVGKRAGAVKALQRRGLEAVRIELEREGVPL